MGEAIESFSVLTGKGTTDATKQENFRPAQEASGFFLGNGFWLRLFWLGTS